jgi:hypothetical protein
LGQAGADTAGIDAHHWRRWDEAQQPSPSRRPITTQRSSTILLFGEDRMAPALPRAITDCRYDQQPAQFRSTNATAIMIGVSLFVAACAATLFANSAGSITG